MFTLVKLDHISYYSASLSYSLLLYEGSLGGRGDVYKPLPPRLP